MRSRPSIDVVILSRDAGPLPERVWAGLAGQQDVACCVHRVIGQPRAADRHRWETIARARNAGRQCGTAPWLMYLDDDVVLPAGAILGLWRALQQSSIDAAMAADYSSQERHGIATRHVTMGATLFRREVLERIPFRWEPTRCECQCMCDDLRRWGWGIRYAGGVSAIHLPRRKPPGSSSESAGAGTASHRGQVLAALDRRHIDKFRRQFLGSLRRSGNHEPVWVVAYGWYPSEVSRMAMLPGVRVMSRPCTAELPPVRRLRDFQTIVTGLDPETPVAYWDAADVIFQDRLEPLWELVRRNRGQLLTVREPAGHPQNPAVRAWSQSIRDPSWRAKVWELLRSSPFLNSGFAAGTADAMLHYLQAADRWRHGPELSGTTDWGDQLALNAYCHLNPDRWCEVPEGWNYCAHQRPRGEIRVRGNGRIETRSGIPVQVLHGNAHSFRQWELLGR